MKNEKKSMPLVYIYAVAIMVVVLGFVGWAFFTQPLTDPRAPLAIFMTLFVGGYCSTVIVDDYVTKHNHRPFVSFGISGKEINTGCTKMMVDIGAKKHLKKQQRYK